MTYMVVILLSKRLISSAYIFRGIWWVPCIVQDALYHNMDIGIMWHCALVSCIPSHSIGLVFGCGLFRYWVSLCVLFTNSLIEFYFIMRVVIIIGILWPLLLFWNTCLGFLNLVLQMRTSMDVSVPGHSLWILDWTCYFRTPLCYV